MLMNIVVLVKQVPDTYSERRLRSSDGSLDRDATDAVLDEINERAVEAALRLTEAGAGPDDGSEVTVLAMGPDRATEAIRKALSMGADKAVHLSAEALAGSDAVSTAQALVTAIGTRGSSICCSPAPRRPTVAVGRRRQWSPTCWVSRRSPTPARSPSMARR
jgi:electron transfer flavoprotein beta subunit